MPLFGDEGIRAAVSLEMLLSNNFLVPTTWGEPYYYKTPLYNWILAGFFWLFEPSEFVLRLPAVLSLFGLGLSMFLIGRKDLGNRLALYAAFAFVLSGRLLTRDSMLGHIDLFFALVSFLQICSIWYFSQKKNYLALFMVSYALLSAGVLMKGLPSLLFQAITLAIWLYVTKEMKRLFSVQHLAGIALAVILCGSYFFLYSMAGDELTYFNRLYEQSAQRSLLRFDLWKSFLKFLSFIPENLAHLFPSSLLLILLFRNGVWNIIKANSFAHFSVLALLFNLIPYALSPGYYPRYLFMLYPLFFIVVFFVLRHFGWKAWQLKSFKAWNILVFLILLAALLYAHFAVDLSELKHAHALLLTCVAFLLVSSFLLWKFKADVFMYFFAFLILFRLAFDLLVIPYRVVVERGPRVLQKEQTEKILSLTKGERLGLWTHTPVPENYAFYFAREKREIIRRSYDFVPGDFYLIPASMAEENAFDILYRYNSGYENIEVCLIKAK